MSVGCTLFQAGRLRAASSDCAMAMRIGFAASAAS
jgi:hypothetical protein